MRLAPLVLAALLALPLAGCSGSRPTVQGIPGAEEDWRKASESYEKGDYVRAVERLTAFVDSHPGSSQLDTALLYLGLSHQQTGENLLAVEDFNRLIRDFPQSPHRERAEYELARSHLEEALGPAKDPEHTEKALEMFRSYLTRHPQGEYVAQAQAGVEEALERLAMKAWLNAETYLRLGRPKAAVIYIEKALEVKPDFRRAGEALAALARARAELGETEAAREAWQRLVDYATPERVQRDGKLTDLRREAEAALRR